MIKFWLNEIDHLYPCHVYPRYLAVSLNESLSLASLPPPHPVKSHCFDTYFAESACNILRVKYVNFTKVFYWFISQRFFRFIPNLIKIKAVTALIPGADWPVGLLGWGPKGPPQQRSQWAPSVLEEKYFKWLILDELSDSDKTTTFNQRKIG